MKLQIQIKNVYGNEMVYPICEVAKKFAELLGQKTLTYRDMKIIAAMGYEFEAVNNFKFAA